MPRLLVNSVEGAKHIPFARGRLRALRAAGLTNITQRYEVQGASVRVTINGDEEIIEITDSSWDYLVLPTSTAHPKGVKTKEGVDVPPVASLTLTGSEKGLKRKENSKLEAGPHDWISKDAKHSLSYNHGHGFRYRMAGVLLDTGLDMDTHALYYKGRKKKTALPVSGAAIFTAKNRTGTTVTKTVYSSTEQGSRTLHIRASSLRLDENGDPIEEVLATWHVTDAGYPGYRMIEQPVFFSGDGTKFVTVISTRSRDKQGLEPPHYALRGTLSLNESGGIDVSMTESVLELSPEHGTTTLVRSVYNPYNYWDPDTPKTSYDGTNPLTLSDITETSYAAHYGEYISASGRSALGVEEIVSDERRVQLIGLDMAADGTELLVEKVTDHVSTFKDFYSHDSFYTTAITVTLGPEVPHWPWESPYAWVRTQIDYTGKLRIEETFATRSLITDSFTVNGEPIASFVTHDRSTGGTKLTTYNGSSSSIDGVFTGPPTANIETYTPEFSTRAARILSVRGIDARARAIALIISEYSVDYSYTSKRPLKVILRAHCEGHEFNKTVFNGQIIIAPGLLGVNVSLYRPFASRRPGEFVICFSPDDYAYAQPNPADTYGFFAVLERQGAVDREPLIAVCRKGKVITPATNKFSLGTEPGFRFDPIHVL